METPLTLSLIGLNAFAFYVCKENIRSRNFYTQKYGFISSFAADGEYYRFLSFNFVHLDWSHFAGNMLCLQQSGTTLEKKYGTQKFAFLVIEILCLLGPIQLFLTHAWSFITNDHSVLYRRVIGFSGVIFAFKSLIYKDELPKLKMILQKGITASSLQHPISELIFTSILFYNSSFSGHLSGLMTGLILAFDYQGWFQKYWGGGNNNKPTSSPKSR
jgi:membrane associated rhomboid family serine protease